MKRDSMNGQHKTERKKGTIDKKAHDEIDKRHMSSLYSEQLATIKLNIFAVLSFLFLQCRYPALSDGCTTCAGDGGDVKFSAWLQLYCMKSLIVTISVEYKN